jgi:hypothetical protein
MCRTPPVTSTPFAQLAAEKNHRHPASWWRSNDPLNGMQLLSLIKASKCRWSNSLNAADGWCLRWQCQAQNSKLTQVNRREIDLSISASRHLSDLGQTKDVLETASKQVCGSPSFALCSHKSLAKFSLWRVASIRGDFTAKVLYTPHGTRRLGFALQVSGSAKLNQVVPPLLMFTMWL